MVQDIHPAWEKERARCPDPFPIPCSSMQEGAERESFVVCSCFVGEIRTGDRLFSIFHSLASNQEPEDEEPGPERVKIAPTPRRRRLPGLEGGVCGRNRQIRSSRSVTWSLATGGQAYFQY